MNDYVAVACCSCIVVCATCEAWTELQKRVKSSLPRLEPRGSVRGGGGGQGFKTELAAEYLQCAKTLAKSVEQQLKEQPKLGPIRSRKWTEALPEDPDSKQALREAEYALTRAFVWSMSMRRHAVPCGDHDRALEWSILTVLCDIVQACKAFRILVPWAQKIQLSRGAPSIFSSNRLQTSRVNTFCL